MLPYQMIGIIPARYGSSRFPGKPLVKILGKSLLQRTYENALSFKELNDLVVATDDSRIVDHVKSFGGKVVMTSPLCLTGTDRLAEVIREFYASDSIDFVFNIQGDEPLLLPLVISRMSELLLQDPSICALTVATPLSSCEEAAKPSIVKCVLDKNSNALYFSRSLIPGNKQGSFHHSTPYYRHLGLYCYSKQFLLKYEHLSPTPLQLIEDLEQLKILEHGFRMKVAIVPEAALSVGVDLPEDIRKVEEILCNQNLSSSLEA